MTPDDLTHEEKDDLIRLTKKALEMACARLACYEGFDSPTANPEEWVVALIYQHKLRDGTMTKEYDNVLEAKRTVRKLITFLETLLENLKKPDKTFRGYAVVTAWCIDRYFSEKLSTDIQEVIAQLEGAIHV